jgi:hypothetical protein
MDFGPGVAQHLSRLALSRPFVRANSPENEGGWVDVGGQRLGVSRRTYTVSAPYTGIFWTNPAARAG